jgi:hypothetical protein
MDACGSDVAIYLIPSFQGLDESVVLDRLQDSTQSFRRLQVRPERELQLHLKLQKLISYENNDI